MSWINRDDLIEWLHTEEDEMLEIDDRREAHEASYIRKHVREMPGMDVSQVMQELKRYCDKQPRCNDCPFWYDPCNGNLPMALRRIAAKMDEQENGAEDES
jgi:hypothetical protein